MRRPFLLPARGRAADVDLRRGIVRDGPTSLSTAPAVAGNERAGMIRSIVGFHADDVGEWVAELSCFHNQHVRHRPPFQERAWVLDPLGRAGHIGSATECPLCDRAELPQGLSLVGRAGPWDQDRVPRALLRSHRVPDGRWGRLRVHAGAVDFQFEGGDDPELSTRHLRTADEQAIPPGSPHHVVLTGAVQLEIEFWGRP